MKSKVTCRYWISSWISCQHACQLNTKQLTDIPQYRNTASTQAYVLLQIHVQMLKTNLIVFQNEINGGLHTRYMWRNQCPNIMTPRARFHRNTHGLRSITVLHSSTHILHTEQQNIYFKEYKVKYRWQN